jgi:hypothetical protein
VFDVSADPSAIRGKLLEFLSSKEGQGVWVLKASSRNNALGVHILDSAAVARRDARTLARIEALATEQEKKAVSATVSDSPARSLDDACWLLQRHVRSPLLLGGRKFHLRVNAVAVGCMALYVHADPVAHVAAHAFRAASEGCLEDCRTDWADTSVHITNHCTQANVEGFCADTCTLRLPALRKALQRDLGEERGAKVCSNLWARARHVVRETFLAFVGRKRQLYPMPNSFEVFGFDFMFDEKGSPRLLEVNSGPGLEGHCCPEVCASAVRDALTVALDPVLSAAHLLEFPVSSGKGTIAGVSVEINGGEGDSTGTDTKGGDGGDAPPPLPPPVDEVNLRRAPSTAGTALELLWSGGFLKGSGPPVIWTRAFVERVRACVRSEEVMRCEDSNEKCEE